MNDDRNPQREQMADESMVRTLAAQAIAIWPQERELVRRYGLSGPLEILDAGCGTGEVSARLLEEFPEARLLGVDVIEEHLARARTRCSAYAGRAVFELRSAYDLDLPDRHFDLTVCRHVVQSIPHAELVLEELARVTRRGGRLHVIAEDYGMLHFQRRQLDPDDFWQVRPKEYGRALGVDLHVGRNVFTHLARLGLAAITLDYVIVDTLRVPREVFAAIIESWRDGYVDPVAEHTSATAAEVRAHFDDMLLTLRDPERYAVWLVPVVSAVVP